MISWSFVPRLERNSLEPGEEPKDEQLRRCLDKIREIVGDEKYNQTVFPILLICSTSGFGSERTQGQDSVIELQPQKRKL